MRLLVTLALACGVLCAQTTPEPASVEGTVLNAATGEGLRKANVKLVPLQNGTSLSSTSEASGRFLLTGVAPGQYLLIVDRNGFVAQPYGSKATNQPAATLRLAPGQNLTDVTIRLVPQGVIMGRVIDEDGDPIPHVSVRALRSLYTRGRKQLQARQSAETNDLGEYRLYGLVPGKYYLNAEYTGFEVTVASPKARPKSYATVYYPNSPAADSAAPVEVAAGAQVRGVDLTLVKIDVFHLRGHVGGPARNVMLQDSAGRVRPIVGGGPKPNGNFDIPNVPPGSYLVSAESNDGTVREFGRLRVEVGSSDVDGLELTLAPLLEMRGRLVIENNRDTRNAHMAVSLTPNDPFGLAPPTTVFSNGSTEWKNLLPGRYLVGVSGLPDNFYVKSVHHGDADITEAGLDLSQGSAASLTVLASPNGGEIDGSLQDAQQQPSAGSTVVLVPETSKRALLSLYRIATTDTTGKFALKGIAPGNYKLFAWELIAPNAWYDADILKLFDSRGEDVSIQEGDRQNKSLKVIAAEDVPEEARQN
jgi:hypothetical protein